MTTAELYLLAKKQNIETHTVSCPKSKAITVNIKNKKHIGIDPSVYKNEYDERLILAHEIGHALADAYYTDFENPVNIIRMEHRANKKTVEILVPKDQLDQVIDENSTVFELADYFSVPEETIKKALWFYYRKQLP